MTDELRKIRDRARTLFSIHPWLADEARAAFGEWVEMVARYDAARSAARKDGRAHDLPDPQKTKPGELDRFTPKEYRVIALTRLAGLVDRGAAVQIVPEPTSMIPPEVVNPSAEQTYVSARRMLLWRWRCPVNKLDENTRDEPARCELPTDLAGQFLAMVEGVVAERERGEAAQVVEMKPVPAKLPKTRRGLQRLAQTSTMDTRIIALVNAGQSYRAVGEELHVSKSTVARVANAYGLTGDTPETVPLGGTLSENLTIMSKPRKAMRK